MRKQTGSGPRAQWSLVQSYRWRLALTDRPDLPRSVGATFRR